MILSDFLRFIGLVSVFSFSLIGCKPVNTESYYFEHPKVLQSVLLDCRKNGDTPVTFNSQCQLAYQTAVTMTNLMQAFVDSPTEFGQRILHAQIHASELSQALILAEKANLPDY
ncbi:MAG: hypothetical protein LRY43_00280 [Gammaproteobacteria bacterium]|nr:hypothetical protein [Gammaproteobacteria bacterium]